MIVILRFLDFQMARKILIHLLHGGRRVIWISGSLIWLKILMELIFNPCSEFQWSPEGPVSQIHSLHLHVGAPGIFTDLLRSVQMSKREWGGESNGMQLHIFNPSLNCILGSWVCNGRPAFGLNCSLGAWWWLLERALGSSSIEFCKLRINCYFFMILILRVLDIKMAYKILINLLHWGRRVIGISGSLILSKILMELIFNHCCEFQWSPDGPVSQLHSPHLHVSAPGIFTDLSRSAQMPKREWGAESNVKLLHLCNPWLNYSLGSWVCDGRPVFCRIAP